MISTGRSLLSLAGKQTMVARSAERSAERYLEQGVSPQYDLVCALRSQNRANEAWSWVVGYLLTAARYEWHDMANPCDCGECEIDRLGGGA